MSYETYRLLHFAGLFLTVLALGASMQAQPVAERPRGFAAVKGCHGAGLFLVLLGGFGMLARLGLSFAAAPWVWLKLLAWAGFGGAILLPRRRPDAAWVLWVLVPALGLLATWAVMRRPWS